MLSVGIGFNGDSLRVEVCILDGKPLGSDFFLGIGIQSKSIRYNVF